MATKKHTKNKGKSLPALDRNVTALHLLPWLLLIPLGLFLPDVVSKSTDWIENVYSSSIYPVISSILITTNSIFGFSIAEALLVLVILFVLGLLIFMVFKLISKKMRVIRFVNTLLILLIVAGAMINLFYITWGFNYFRRDLKYTLSLDVHERSVEELSEVCDYLADMCVELRKNIKTDQNGIFTFDGSIVDKAEEYKATYAALSRDFSCFSGVVGVPKPVMMSEGLSYAGISGIYIPFTAEPNVNVHQPPLLQLSTAAHELAHQQGFAHEEDANFIAFLCGLYSDDPDIAYSCAMLTLITCGNRLSASDSQAYNDLYSRYSVGMLADLDNYSKYWKGYEGEIKQAAQNANNNYLQHNEQEDGIKSYGRMTDLVLAYYFEYLAD